MRKILFIFTFLLPVTLLSGPADACEPLYPFLIKFVFPSSMSGSVYGLLAGVIVKSALFAYLVRQVTWFKAAGSMFLANTITSLFGVFLAVFLSMPIALILILCWPSSGLPTHYRSDYPTRLFYFSENNIPNIKSFSCLKKKRIRPRRILFYRFWL
jgi:hypothetical protein